jgi:hypothetical protein
LEVILFFSVGFDVVKGKVTISKCPQLQTVILSNCRGKLVLKDQNVKVVIGCEEDKNNLQLENSTVE